MLQPAYCLGMQDTHEMAHRSRMQTHLFNPGTSALVRFFLAQVRNLLLQNTQIITKNPLPTGNRHTVSIGDCQQSCAQGTEMRFIV